MSALAAIDSQSTKDYGLGEGVPYVSTNLLAFKVDLPLGVEMGLRGIAQQLNRIAG